MRWVDDYINQLRDDPARANRSDLISHFAAFVGESLIARYGGEWSQDKSGEWGVSLTGSAWVCPLIKVQKQFQNGPTDSVAAFFESIPDLDRHLTTSPAWEAVI